MYQSITVISSNLVEKNNVSVSKYRSNKIFIYSGALAVVVVVVERCRHVLLFVLILAIRKGLNHGAEARRRLGIPRSTIYEQRYTLFLFRPVRGSVGSVVVASCGLRYEATFPPSPLPLCICGVVCHSQVLAKYARPFVSDLLFWHRRCSTLAANRIKCFCRVLSLFAERIYTCYAHVYVYCMFHQSASPRSVSFYTAIAMAARTWCAATFFSGTRASLVSAGPRNFCQPALSIIYAPRHDPSSVVQ